MPTLKSHAPAQLLVVLTCKMELFWLQSTMGLLLSLCTSKEKVKCRLPTACATSSLQASNSGQSQVELW